MRVVIAGGGTGGHVYPGIAVAEEFRKRDNAVEILFIGTEHGIESRVIPKEGFNIRFIKVGGVLGRSLMGKAYSIIKIARSVFVSMSIYRAGKPDIVIGTGGYVSAGPVTAAFMKSIPTMLLEQNLVPGMANRLLAKIADCVAITYHESMNYMPKDKTHLTGNPIRGGILKGDRKNALRLFSLDEDKLTVFVSGGSRGARKINTAMMDGLAMLNDRKDALQFLHQTGEDDYETVRKAYRDRGFKAMVAPFIYQMPEAYAIADVMVSRAGATTLAEITAMGIASILIPYPHAAGHQMFNAEKLLEADACRVVLDQELTGDRLGAEIMELSDSSELRARMRRGAMALGRPDAAKRVVDLAMSIVRAGNV